MKFKKIAGLFSESRKHRYEPGYSSLDVFFGAVVATEDQIEPIVEQREERYIIDRLKMMLPLDGVYELQHPFDADLSIGIYKSGVAGSYNFVTKTHEFLRKAEGGGNIDQLVEHTVSFSTCQRAFVKRCVWEYSTKDQSRTPVDDGIDSLAYLSYEDIRDIESKLTWHMLTLPR